MKKSVLFVMLCLVGSMAVCGQSVANDGKTFIGINAGHLFVVPLVSRAMNDANVTYLPIHINAYHSMSKNFALSGLLLFRSEKDYGFQSGEFGFAVGPCYTTNYLNGFFADCKVGVAFAVGNDYQYNDYTRADFVIQPEVGYFLTFASRFTMSLGLGCQSLLKISENPKRENTGWEWNNTGKMSHYYLPVLNISFGIKL